MKLVEHLDFLFQSRTHFITLLLLPLSSSFNRKTLKPILRNQFVRTTKSKELPNQLSILQDIQPQDSSKQEFKVFSQQTKGVSLPLPFFAGFGIFKVRIATDFALIQLSAFQQRARVERMKEDWIVLAGFPSCQAESSGRESSFLDCVSQSDMFRLLP